MSTYMKFALPGFGLGVALVIAVGAATFDRTGVVLGELIPHMVIAGAASGALCGAHGLLFDLAKRLEVLYLATLLGASHAARGALPRHAARGGLPRAARGPLLA